MIVNVLQEYEVNHNLGNERKMVSPVVAWFKLFLSIRIVMLV